MLHFCCSKRFTFWARRAFTSYPGTSFAPWIRLFVAPTFTFRFRLVSRCHRGGWFRRGSRCRSGGWFRRGSRCRRGGWCLCSWCLGGGRWVGRCRRGGGGSCSRGCSGCSGSRGCSRFRVQTLACFAVRLLHRTTLHTLRAAVTAVKGTTRVVVVVVAYAIALVFTIPARIRRGGCRRGGCRRGGCHRGGGGSSSGGCRGGLGGHTFNRERSVRTRAFLASKFRAELVTSTRGGGCDRSCQRFTTHRVRVLFTFARCFLAALC